MSKRAAFSGAVLCFLLFTSVADAQSIRTLSGWKTEITTSECNRFVPNPLKQLDELSFVGDYMGFYLRTTAHPNPDFKDVTYGPGSMAGNHMQSIGRLMRQKNSQYVVITRSVNSYYLGDHLAVVQFGSRTDRNGFRFRSNRMDPAKDPDDTPPPATDVVVKSTLLKPCICPSSGKSCNFDWMYHDSTPDKCIACEDPDTFWEGWNHAGGMQIIGDYGVVALEQGAKVDNGRVILVDFRNPLEPKNIYELDLGPNGKDPWGAGIVKLSDGTYLLAVFVNDGGNKIWFYKSRNTSLCNPNASNVCQGPDFQSDPIIKYSWEAGPQNISLLADENGQLYVWAGDKSEYDRLMLWELVINEMTDAWGRVLYQAGLYKLRDKHIYCTFRGDPKQCDLDSASGIYIDPDGRLLVYATEHDNGGPRYEDAGTETTDGSVRMMEFRSAVDPGPSVTSIETAWVELYADPYYNEGNENSATLMIDYADREEENLCDFSKIGLTGWNFNNNISSMRYDIPVGWEFECFAESGCAGSPIVSTGHFAGSFNDLRTMSGVNDNISSCQFVRKTSIGGVLGGINGARNLPSEVKNSYLANLKKMAEFVSRGRTIPAMNQLNAFMHKVETDLNHNKISSELGERIIQVTNTLVQKIEEGQFE